MSETVKDAALLPVRSNAGLAMCCARCEEPTRDGINGNSVEVSKRRETVVSVKNFDIPVPEHDDKRLGDGQVLNDVLCTYPKPMLSVLEICDHCRRLTIARARRDDLVKNLGRDISEWCRPYVDGDLLPAAGEPRG